MLPNSRIADTCPFFPRSATLVSSGLLYLSLGAQFHQWLRAREYSPSVTLLLEGLALFPTAIAAAEALHWSVDLGSLWLARAAWKFMRSPPTIAADEAQQSK